MESRMQYNYHIMPLAARKIRSFYRNVSLKYSNTYSYDDMYRNINEAVDAIYGIEQSLLRRKPTLERWQGCHMARAGKWYYAYIISGNTIVIKDACHAQNMH